MEKNIIKYGVALATLIIGIVLKLSGVGENEFLGFGSVGGWLIFVAMVMVFATAIRGKKERKVDERMLHVAAKANRLTFIGIIVGATVVMIIDGISPITVPYQMFMSFMVCAIMVMYAVSYKILLRYN